MITAIVYTDKKRELFKKTRVELTNCILSLLSDVVFKHKFDLAMDDEDDRDDTGIQEEYSGPSSENGKTAVDIKVVWMVNIGVFLGRCAGLGLEKDIKEMLDDG